jgi:hypothetical protein
MTEDLRRRGVWTNSWRVRAWPLRAWRWITRRVNLILAGLVPPLAVVGLRMIGVQSPAFTMPGAWLSPTNVLVALCAVVLIALLVEARRVRRKLGDVAADLADSLTERESRAESEIRVPPYDSQAALRLGRPLSDSERTVAESAARIDGTAREPIMPREPAVRLAPSNLPAFARSLDDSDRMQADEAPEPAPALAPETTRQPDSPVGSRTRPAVSAELAIEASGASRTATTRPPPGSEQAGSAGRVHVALEPPASAPVLSPGPGILAAGLGERPTETHSERPPPHAPPVPMRRATLAGIIPPPHASPRPPPAAPPPLLPVTPAAPPARTRAPVSPSPKRAPFVPPALAPAPERAVPRSGDEDDGDSSAWLSERPSDVDGVRTVVGKLPTAAELAAGKPAPAEHGAGVNRTAATLPSMSAVGGPRPELSAEQIARSLAAAGATAGDEDEGTVDRGGDAPAKH